MVLIDRLCQTFEHPVPSQVVEGVIDALEATDIENDQALVASKALAPGYLALKILQEIAVDRG